MTTDLPEAICSHFSISNVVDKGETLSSLVRRLAGYISKLNNNAMILDITFESQTLAAGERFTFTVYYAPNGWAALNE